MAEVAFHFNVPERTAYTCRLLRKVWRSGQRAHVVLDAADLHALDIAHFPDDENYETIAGFMMYMLRKMPKLTDAVSHAGYKFEVVDIDNHRIDQLLVTRVQ